MRQPPDSIPPRRHCARATRRRTALRFAVLATCLSGCIPGEPIAENAIRRFVEAVQSEDVDRLFCMLAGASTAEATAEDAARERADFGAWARSRYVAYDTGRDLGGVRFDEDGIALVKAFTLGKGTFYSLDAVRHTESGRLLAETTVRFGYGHVNYANLSPGTTFYLAAAPPGRIESVRIPFGSGEVTEEVLETVRVRWELARVAETRACPERWTVVAVTPVEGSETTTQVTWNF